jgi:hypothetical protein
MKGDFEGWKIIVSQTNIINGLNYDNNNLRAEIGKLIAHSDEQITCTEACIAQN